jgi:hypothetical protein
MNGASIFSEDGIIHPDTILALLDETLAGAESCGGTGGVTVRIPLRFLRRIRAAKN